MISLFPSLVLYFVISFCIYSFTCLFIYVQSFFMICVYFVRQLVYLSLYFIQVFIYLVCVRFRAFVCLHVHSVSISFLRSFILYCLFVLVRSLCLSFVLYQFRSFVVYCCFCLLYVLRYFFVLSFFLSLCLAFVRSRVFVPFCVVSICV